MAENAMKGFSPEEVDEVELEDQGVVDPSVPVKYRGTVTDKKDMKVLGKVQVLRVSAQTAAA
jgi:hypothetical protein